MIVAEFKIERQTYSLLEWVGDVGGLYDGLLIVLGPIFSLTTIFSYQPSQSPSNLLKFGYWVLFGYIWFGNPSKYSWHCHF